MMPAIVEELPAAPMASPGERAICEECHRWATIYDDGMCHRCVNRIDKELTPDALEAMIQRQLKTMPKEREERRLAACGAGRKQRYAVMDKPYEQSPHGAGCPLIRLIEGGQGGFTRAIMEADEWLRKRPDADVRGEWQSADGDTVRLTLANGETVQFPTAETHESKTMKARKCGVILRLMIAGAVLKRGAMTLLEIEKAVRQDRELIRIALRSCGWFVRVQVRKWDSPYDLSATGRAEYHAANKGRPA